MKKSGKEWMRRHVTDPYVKKSQKEGYRSRAVYKLLEIQEKDRIFKPGMTVVDLGAAPGSWSQIAQNLVGDHGTVIAMDILPMDSLAGVFFLQGDFREQDVYNELKAILENRPVDVVICDMAPNISGMKGVDQPRSMYLAELALEFSEEVLKPGGDFLCKVFQGEGIDEFRKLLQQKFSKVLTRKPKASRSESSEVYYLARNRIV